MTNVIALHRNKKQNETPFAQKQAMVINHLLKLKAEHEKLPFSYINGFPSGLTPNDLARRLDTALEYSMGFNNNQNYHHYVIDKNYFLLDYQIIYGEDIPVGIGGKVFRTIDGKFTVERILELNIYGTREPCVAILLGGEEVEVDYFKILLAVKKSDLQAFPNIFEKVNNY